MFVSFLSVLVFSFSSFYFLCLLISVFIFFFLPSFFPSSFFSFFPSFFLHFFLYSISSFVAVVCLVSCMFFFCFGSVRTFFPAVTSRFSCPKRAWSGGRPSVFCFRASDKPRFATAEAAAVFEGRGNGASISSSTVHNNNTVQILGNVVYLSFTVALQAST